MNVKNLKYFAVGCLGMAMVGCQTDEIENQPTEVDNITFQKPETITGRYIVVYDNSTGKIAPLQKTRSSAEYSAQMRTLKSTFLAEFSDIDLNEENIVQTYGHTVKGFAAELNSAQLSSLKKDPRVLYIEEDKVITLAPGGGKPGGGTATPPAQETPYGTTRVGGGTTMAGGTAWIIDSGIDQDHPDLNVDTARSISFLSRDNNPDDQNGHGTHVAGTIGAKDNEIGSLGVAPGTLVAAVRVLDRRGSGAYSGVIAGVDYVGSTGVAGDVANMSLGGGVSDALDAAVIAASKNVIFTLAAGNESDNANNHSPARAGGKSSNDNVYTISAMNNLDNWASFSNFGNAVEYCAPGVGVYSTWKDGGYNTISGTSMAAPHAAGVLLLGNPITSGTVNGDPDGNPDPIIHI
ncbi:Peptidase inhibitor I9 [Flavobacteriaceae bacterium MAR_2010_188]|nr:Peptidase inhibitor I9 [Flavobacteriaceae bacterium MAR_2010_188]